MGIAILIIFTAVALFRLAQPIFRKWKREAAMVKTDRDEAELPPRFL